MPERNMRLPDKPIDTPNGVTHTQLGVWNTDAERSEEIEFIVDPEFVFVYESKVELEPWTDEDEIEEWKEEGDEFDEDHVRGMRCFSLPILKSVLSGPDQQLKMAPTEVLKCYKLDPYCIKGWVVFEDFCEVENYLDDNYAP